MKYIMLAFLSAGLIFSGNPRPIIKPMIIDDGSTIPATGHGERDGYCVDSSAGQYTLALTHQECIAYNDLADAIAVVNRDFSVSGVLNVHTANGALSYWLDDWSAYGQDLGPARYPTAIAADAAPYISFPFLYSGAWGGAGAQFCSGGWFSSQWDPPVQLGIGNQYVQTVIGKELPNGNMCFILYGTNPFQLYYRTYAPGLTALLDSGTLSPPATYYWGWDSNKNGGIAFVFYCDNNLNIYYRSSTDGITWTAEQTYNMVWPDPYANNLIDLSTGVQACVTDSGSPILIFDIRNGDDGTYPPYSKVYVSTASGATCTRISPDWGTADSECYYSTITTGGNTVGVIYCMPRNNFDDSLTWNDVYYTQSGDNGRTWSEPTNQTAYRTRRTSIPQVAKRFDSLRNRAYILFGDCMLGDVDLMWGYDAQSARPTRIYFQTVQIGIEENRTELPKRIALSVTPNPATGCSKISYALPASGNVSLMLYSADGRLIKTLDYGFKTAGAHAVKVQDLANGLYFVILESPSGCASRSLVFVK